MRHGVELIEQSSQFVTGIRAVGIVGDQTFAADSNPAANVMCSHGATRIHQRTSSCPSIHLGPPDRLCAADSLRCQRFVHVEHFAIRVLGTPTHITIRITRSERNGDHCPRSTRGLGWIRWLFGNRSAELLACDRHLVVPPIVCRRLWCDQVFRAHHISIVCIATRFHSDRTH